MTIATCILKTRSTGGGARTSGNWGVNSDTGVLRDVLLGPPGTFPWMEDNAKFSTIFATGRHGF